MRRAAAELRARDARAPEALNPWQLWAACDGDSSKFLQLMREHGHLAKQLPPGDYRYRVVRVMPDAPELIEILDGPLKDKWLEIPGNHTKPPRPTTSPTYPENESREAIALRVAAIEWTRANEADTLNSADPSPSLARARRANLKLLDAAVAFGGLVSRRHTWRGQR